ncbi:MAG: hypothetical protein IPG58_04500 [Acidobacteria bacterium]|nr:hypothetical protein [Acidobacteriota bacterium]
MRSNYGLIGVAAGCGLSIPGDARTGVSVDEFEGGLPSGTGCRIAPLFPGTALPAKS